MSSLLLSRCLWCTLYFFHLSGWNETSSVTRRLLSILWPKLVSKTPKCSETSFGEKSQRFQKGDWYFLVVLSKWTSVRRLPWSENTNLLCKGKYHWTAGLLFDQLGFGQTSKSVYSFNSTKQLNPNQSNRRSAVQWYFPLWSKWVFSALIYWL